MEKVSASQAAKMAGKSIPTITRAIKSGKISAEKKESGGYLIEVSELERVFPLKSPNSDVTQTKLGSETPSNLNALEREIELLRERVDELKGQRDQWQEQAAKISGLIENQQASRTPSVTLLDRLLPWRWDRAA